MHSLPEQLTVRGRRFTMRRATRGDVAGIVDLLRDDPLGATREAQDMTVYQRAFRAIDQDPNQLLVTVDGDEGALAATMQLTLIPGLSRGGTSRLQIEAVRVARTERGDGLGRALLTWAEQYALTAGAGLLQLTTDKTRGGAHRFYAGLGYSATHEGFKKSVRAD